MKFLARLFLLPVDLVFLTVDAWIITYGTMARLLRREKDQPCHLCRGEDHSHSPHPVRSVLKYSNGWLLRLLAPCIRFQREEGRRVAFCHNEGGFTRAPASASLVAITLSLFWLLLVAGILGVATSDPDKSVLGNIVGFFNPGRSTPEIDFLEGGESRHNPERAERYFLSAVRYFDKQEYAKALVDFRNAIQSDPGDPRIHFQYARTLLATRETIQGEQSLRKTLELDENHVEALLILCEILESKENRAEALAFASRALAQEPDNLKALRINAGLNAAENKPDIVRPLLDRLLELDGGNSDTLAFAANLETSLFRDPEVAGALLEKSLSIKPDHIPSLMGRIPLLLSAQDFQQIDGILERVLELKPDYLPALRTQADLLLGRYGLGAGLRVYANLIGRFAGDMGLRLRYAELLMQAGNFSESKRLLLQMTGSRIPAFERTAYWLLARMHAQIRLHEDAVEFGRQTLLRTPDNRDVQAFIAQELLALNRPAEARIQLEAALARNRDNASLVLLLSEAMVAQGRRQEAIDYIGKLLGENPESDLLRRRLVELRMVSSEWALALPDTRLLHEKYPNEPAFKNNLAFLLARSKTELDEALRLARELSEQFPDNPLILDTLAYTLAAHQRHGEAVLLFEQALAKMPGNSNIRTHYARSLLALGRQNDARRELQTSLIIDPTHPDAPEAAALLKQLDPGA